VTLVGSLQSELGCPADWDPTCAATQLTYDATDDVWQATFTVPAGTHEYKVALDGSWAENYGANAQRDGPNIRLELGTGRAVKFYYSHATNWITDNVNSTIAVAPGSFQSELGCPGDWQPDCLRSWLQDPDGDRIYTFETTAIPAGSYEAKVALHESWDVNYGAGGVPGGPNIPFTVAAAGQRVTFRFDATTNILTIQGGHGRDNRVALDGLRHDSRDTLYRTPGGAVPAGTPVILRFRTFHNDVTAVWARFWSINRAGESIEAMTRVATAVGCYQPDLAGETCDFWQLRLPADLGADNLWYRFIVSDGTATVYYADDTPAIDGGLGQATDHLVDHSWALMLYEPDFTAPAWAESAVVYQIFPDRFRDGRRDNNPRTGDRRYDDPAIRLPWGTLPEGYCRHYADAAVACPWRFDDSPPAWSPTVEWPRGRDYFGGDLEGIRQSLGYLARLGVNTLKLNPIFDAGSNHAYDTQDYFRIDPYFGTRRDWTNLVRHAERHGIRIILDGVFNHVSSDSPFFDRYGHYPTVGACESVDSPWRSWFTFRPLAGGPCAGPDGPNTMTYDAWWGFDTLPVLVKTRADVQEYFLTGPDSVAKYWLRAGAAGWRLDVSSDASFPAGYWETFRAATRAVEPESLSIGEGWQKDSTLLRKLRGDRLDTTMNYRLRDAVIGLLTPQPFDPKGFADSGHRITPSQFANRLASVREDYPDAAYFSLMNILGSHDTERILWTLTEGPETTAGRENPAAMAAGRTRVQLASLIQFTLAGMPTIFYGDEIGMTGDDDPDSRRTFPWRARGALHDTALLAHYRTLAALRRDDPALRQGDFRILLADDATGTVAYGRRTETRGAVIALNVSPAERTLRIPVTDYLPDGTLLWVRHGVGLPAGGSVTVAGGAVEITLPAMGGVYLGTDETDLAGPPPPVLRVAAERANAVDLAWDAVPDAAAYNVYVSPVTGGGYVKANVTPITGTVFTVEGLPNAKLAYFVVRAIDAAGNLGADSNEVSAIPHPTIGWANLQWPPSMTHTISAVNRTDMAYGQVWIDGVTNAPGPSGGLRAQLGFGPAGSDPRGADWTWVEAAFNVQAGNNDEFKASMFPTAVGVYDYVFRYSVTDGRDWLYADLGGPVAPAALPARPGVLTVVPSGDTTPPAIPTGLRVVAASPAGIELAWDPVLDDPSLHGYEVGRRDGSSGPFTTIGMTTTTSFTDVNVVEGATYEYAVRAVDLSLNRSAYSAPVSATAVRRTVTLVMNVTVPTPVEDAVGRDVFIAGTLDRLDGGLPWWNPAGVKMTKVSDTLWTVSFTGTEGTEIEYKYTLGSWDFVEKGPACEEIANRQLTLSYGATGTQMVNDTVPNWRNVAPCGN
jgi:glycosidase